MTWSLIQPSGKVIGALCATLLCVLTLAARPAAAEPRVALVIGNSQYQGDMPALPNPEKDAKLMARTLKDLGFDVIDKENATQADLKQAISDFGNRLAAAGRNATGFFFYAGHGIQVNGENYLIPVDAKLEKEADADLNAVKVSSIQSQMTYADNAVNIIVLDACRDNPLKGNSRGLKRGLAEIDAVNGMFVAYSTSPGETAADGDGANSPYSAALAQTLKEPGLSIGDVFQEVRTKVLAETGNTQRPWDSSSLTGRFYFNAADASQQVASAQTAPSTTPPPATAPAPDASAEEIQYDNAFWDSVKDSNDPDALQLYLKKYPNGRHVNLANYMLQQMKSGTQVASAQPSQTGAETPSAQRGAISHDDTPPAQPAQQASIAPEVAIIALNQTVYATGDGRVRAAPDGKANLITSFPPNSELTATGRTSDGKWWRIAMTNGQVGYMHRTVVSEQPFQTASSAQQYAAQPTSAGQGAQPLGPDDLQPATAPAQDQSANPPVALQGMAQVVAQQLGIQITVPQQPAAGAQSVPASASFIQMNHQINVRAGAVIFNSPGGQPIYTSRQGGALLATGRSSDGRWYQVSLPNAGTGYVPQQALAP